MGRKDIRELYDQAKDVIFVDSEDKTVKHFKEESDESTVVFSFGGNLGNKQHSIY